MNNEKILYDLIDDNGGTLEGNYCEIAEELHISDTSVRNYAQKLKKQGYLKIKCEWRNMKKTMIFNLTNKEVL